MSDEEQPVERRVAARPNELANSSPDVNHLAMSLVEKFLAIKTWYSTTFAAFLATVWKIAVIGVPAMVTGAILLDKYQDGREAERSFQARMFEMQTDIELKKMDRTMLGDGAMRTLAEISSKLDGQSATTAQIQVSQKTMEEGMQRVSADVSSLKADVGALKHSQAATDRRVGTIAASQAQMRDKMGRE